MRYLSVWPGQKTLTRDFWRQFDDMFQSFADGETLNRELSSFAPALDIEERAKEYVMKFDLPGIDRDQIKVEVKDNTLFVSGERRREEKSEGEYVRYERSYGRFERALTLPRNVESDKIDAKYTDGVLELRIPKTASSVSRMIEVKK